MLNTEESNALPGVQNDNNNNNNENFEYHNDIANDLDQSSFNIEESNALNELPESDDIDILSFNMFSFHMEESNALDELSTTNSMDSDCH